MPRVNPFVRTGRPPAPTSAFGSARPPRAPKGALVGSAPMDGFAAQVPAAAFKRGGSAGFACMPQHHDDSKYKKGIK